MQHKPRAFTLVELLTVIIIMGVVAMIILPQLGAQDDLRLRAACRAIVADLTYAQNQAMTSGKKFYVQVTSSQLSILSRPTDNSSLQLISHPINPGQFTVVLGAGDFNGISVNNVRFDSSAVLAFDELGAPMSYNALSNTLTSLSSPGIIHLQSGNQFMTISIEPYTGELSVSEE